MHFWQNGMPTSTSNYLMAGIFLGLSNRWMVYGGHRVEMRLLYFIGASRTRDYITSTLHIMAFVLLLRQYVLVIFA